jgi:hypothetical protein
MTQHWFESFLVEKDTSAVDERIKSACISIEKAALAEELLD